MRQIMAPALLLFICCGEVPTTPAISTIVDPTVIEARMQEYTSVMRTMDVERIATFYSPTAELFEPGIPPIESRDSILAFMRFFADAKVNSAIVEQRAIEMFDSTAYFWGSYHENLDFPGQPTSDQTGRFVAEWEQQRDGAWLIERMYRIPTSTMVPDSAVMQ